MNGAPKTGRGIPPVGTEKGIGKKKMKMLKPSEKGQRHSDWDPPVPEPSKAVWLR